MAPKHDIRGTRLVFLMLLCSAHALAQGLAGNAGGPYFVNPYESMFGSMGNVYSPYYRQFHAPGITGTGRSAGMSAPGVPYPLNPYSGMFGSMGNVYSPYYRQFHLPGAQGMSGMGSMAGISGIPPQMPYLVNPYAGMYGSTGNVYSPYSRPFPRPGMGGMAGPYPFAGRSGEPGQAGQALYPTFLEPTMGSMSGAN